MSNDVVPRNAVFGGYVNESTSIIGASRGPRGALASSSAESAGGSTWNDANDEGLYGGAGAGASGVIDDGGATASAGSTNGGAANGGAGAEQSSGGSGDCSAEIGSGGGPDSDAACTCTRLTDARPWSWWPGKPSGDSWFESYPREDWTQQRNALVLITKETGHFQLGIHAELYCAESPYTCDVCLYVELPTRGGTHLFYATSGTLDITNASRPREGVIDAVARKVVLRSWLPSTNKFDQFGRPAPGGECLYFDSMEIRVGLP